MLWSPFPRPAPQWAARKPCWWNKLPLESSAEEGLNSGKRITWASKSCTEQTCHTPCKHNFCILHCVVVNWWELIGLWKAGVCAHCSVTGLSVTGKPCGEQWHMSWNTKFFPVCVSCFHSVSFFSQVVFWKHRVLWQVSEQFYFWMIYLREKYLYSTHCRKK